MLQTDIAVSNR